MITLDIKLAIKAVRIVLDDIAKEFDDDFAVDTDIEIEAALKTACRELLRELPHEYLSPKVISSADIADPTSAQVKNNDGTGYVVLPPAFMRLLSFKLVSWAVPVKEPIDPLSEELVKQGCMWTRGTPQKPRVMIDTANNGDKILRYWTAGRHSSPSAEGLANIFNHDIEHLIYIEDLQDETSDLIVPLRQDLYDNVIYRSAGLFLLGKKEQDLADILIKKSIINI